jgi:hypothetical protein
MGLPPPKVTIADIFREAKLRAQWFVGGGHPTKEDPTKRTGIERVSILFELEYWKVLKLLKVLKFLHEFKFHST